MKLAKSKKIIPSMTTPILVRHVKDFCGFTSDQALADVLEVSGVTIMRWRKGMAIPSDEHLLDMIGISGLDIHQTFAEIRSMEGENVFIRQVFHKIHKALAAAAGVIPALLITVHQCILC